MQNTIISGTHFRHNGDYSGEITILSNGTELTIPSEDLLNFAAIIVISKRIQALEQSTYKEIFDIDSI